jgi:hypothetical protein
MYIFRRNSLLDHRRLAEATNAAIDGAALVSSIIDAPVPVWASRLGAPRNVVAWTTPIVSQTELDAKSAKLAADERFQAWVAANITMFETAPTDDLFQLVSTTMDGRPKRFYTTLRSVAAPGKLAEAMAFGVRLQEFVADATGFSTAFTAGHHGSLGEVEWLVGVDSSEALDQLAELQNNAAYGALLDEGGSLFIVGSSQGALVEKVN